MNDWGQAGGNEGRIHLLDKSCKWQYYACCRAGSDRRLEDFVHVRAVSVCFANAAGYQGGHSVLRRIARSLAAEDYSFRVLIPRDSLRSALIANSLTPSG